MAKKKEENPLFIGIANKNELQRGILECSRGILEALKEHEKFKSVREEKIGLVNQFKDEAKEIAKLISVLKKYLPRVKEAKAEKVDAKKIKEEKSKMVKAEESGGRTEIERLESELNDIESKLNRLS